MEPLKLTKRQIQVVEYLAQGLDDKQIAAQLGIGLPDVRAHRASAVQRAGAASRYQLMFWFGERGAILDDSRRLKTSAMRLLDKGEFIRYRERGMSYDEIAKYIGSTKGSVYHWVQQNGLENMPCGGVEQGEAVA